MSTPKQRLESILFIAGRPLTVHKLAAYCGLSVDEARAGLAELMAEYATQRGMQLNRLGDSYQLTTTPAVSALVQRFLEEEEKRELTKPSLETLTIIAYRGPVTKHELELIRGVNCSLILRNLLIRGLVEEVQDTAAMTTRYQLTFDFLQYLGIREPRELPQYETLNVNENLEKLLRASTRPEAESSLSSTEAA